MNTNIPLLRQLAAAFFGAVVCVLPVLAEETDPYQWLEAVDDEKALDWVHKQNKSTAERLTEGPLFKTLYREAREILNSAARLPGVHQEG